VKALTDGDSGVRVAAMQALARLGDARAVEPLAAFLTPAVKGKSDSRETGYCIHAAMALAQLGEPALTRLIGALESGSTEARRAAALALGKLRNPRGVEPLSRALNDARSEVRQAAALSLGDLGERSALERLTTAFGHKDPETRRAAAEAVGRIGGEQAVSLLARAVEDREESVQLAAIEALRHLDGTKAALSLKPAVSAARRSVREAADAALKRMTFPEAMPAERAALAVLTGDFAAAIREGETAVDPLVEALGGPDPARRRRAASALEILRHAKAVPALIRALRDYDSEVRELAAHALAATGPEAVLPLMEAMASPDVTAQKLAARALERIGDSRAVAALVDCVVANRSARDYQEPLEAARAARDALRSILSRAGDAIPAGELQRIACVPDATRELEGGEQEVAVDCSDLRTLSRLELDKRT
jgi:HEAT repeat protein